MRNKLWFLVGHSLKNKINTKAFKIVNVLLIILVVGLINIDVIIKSFGGDFDKKSEILVVDNTGSFYNDLESSYSTLKKETLGLVSQEMKLISYNKEMALSEVEEDNDILIIIDEDESNIISVKLISQNDLDTVLSQVLTQIINSTKSMIALRETKIDQEELAKIYNPVVIETEKLSDEDDMSRDQMMSMIMSTVFPIIILPFFLLAVFVVQFVGTEINEEKTTKSMEIILTNVSAKTHFFSKIIANNAFVLLQGLILILSGIAGIIIRTLVTNHNIISDVKDLLGPTFDVLESSGFIGILPVLIPLVLILMILTFLAYSLLAGVLASMTTSMEEYQQVNLPTMLILMVGYYLSIMAGMFDGALFIRIFSYIPFISAILSPALLILGQIQIFDVIIAIFITLGTIFILYYYGLKIYKIGILNYSSGNIFKKILGAVKN